jgi:hypothetical protein
MMFPLDKLSFPSVGATIPVARLWLAWMVGHAAVLRGSLLIEFYLFKLKPVVVVASIILSGLFYEETLKRDFIKNLFELEFSVFSFPYSINREDLCIRPHVLSPNYLLLV